MATPEALRQWFSPNIEINRSVGGPYRLSDPEGNAWTSGTVLELVPEGGLTLSWMEEGAGWVHPGRLVITLVPVAAGTRVTLTHDGFAGIGQPGWPETVKAYERGADRHRVPELLGKVVTAGDA